MDNSAGMLELARRPLGDDGAVELEVAELGSPLPFPDETFDDVTASLVLHYLEDWGLALLAWPSLPVTGRSPPGRWPRG